MSLRTNNRAVSPVIGALLMFAVLLIVFSSYQAISVPSQNSQIEASHYGTVQDELSQLQGTIITAAESGSSRATRVTLGPTYPVRILAVNAGPPSGQFRTEELNGGEITSSDIPLNEICQLEGGSADAVPTQALSYEPGYNYYRGGDVQHRLEETILYQPTGGGIGALARTEQSIVDAPARSVTLYPLQAAIRAGGTRAQVFRFVGGYGRTTTVSDATVTIPTRAPLALWERQVAVGNPDVAVSNGGTNAIEIIFTGQWEFNCYPVAEGGAPDQLPTAAAGVDTTVSEGDTVELDGTDSQPSSTVTEYSWAFATSPPSGVTLTDEITATPVVDASGADVSAATPVDVELVVTDSDGSTDTDIVTVTITDTDSSSVTPSLTGTADDLPTDSNTTQTISFSPTERTVPSGETVAIDLSDPNGGTSSNPEPVNYGDGSITVDYPTANQNVVTSSGSYIIEWTPSTNLPTSRTVTVEIAKVKTQTAATSGLEVLFSRSDGDGTVSTFALTSGGGNGNDGGENLQRIQAETTTSGGSGKASFALQNTGSSAVTVTKIAVNDTGSSGATEVSRNGNNNYEFTSNATGNLLDGTITVGGTAEPLDTNEQISAGETIEFQFDRFDRDIRGSDIVITISFADGSSQELTLSY